MGKGPNLIGVLPIWSAMGDPSPRHPLYSGHLHLQTVSKALLLLSWLWVWHCFSLTWSAVTPALPMAPSFLCFSQNDPLIGTQIIMPSEVNSHLLFSIPESYEFPSQHLIQSVVMWCVCLFVCTLSVSPPEKTFHEGCVYHFSLYSQDLDKSWQLTNMFWMSRRMNGYTGVKNKHNTGLEMQCFRDKIPKPVIK